METQEDPAGEGVVFFNFVSALAFVRALSLRGRAVVMNVEL